MRIKNSIYFKIYSINNLNKHVTPHIRQPLHSTTAVCTVTTPPLSLSLSRAPSSNQITTAL